MDAAIEQIGLPVKCYRCKERGFVKPRTDYEGWYRVKISGRSRWYCPEHSSSASVFYKSMKDGYKTPEITLTTEQELYKLLED